MIAVRFEVAEWGTGLLHYDGDQLIAVEEPAPRTRTGSQASAPPGAEGLVSRITAFLGGEEVAFDDVDCAAAYDWFGLSELDQRMVEAVRTIPRGETASYREIAELAGRPRAARSAGGACARGPLSIIVPYHRVIRGDGSIGMYGELGEERKRRLLALEGSHAR